LIVIDGSYGEGGGQVLRTALTLSTLLERPLRLENIRAGRPNPGLQAQHLTAVRAMASICRAAVKGDTLGSQTLTFVPGESPQPGNYTFDVAEARQGGSAGAATLVLQTVLLPLALTGGASQLTIRGGTHVAWSPPYHYIQSVYLPVLARMGLRAEVELLEWGWYPQGGGEIKAAINQSARQLSGLNLTERGALLRLHGLAVAANLPAHIPQRMADRAAKLLEGQSVAMEIKPLRVKADCAGAGIFLTAEYACTCGPGERTYAGFSALGARGKPAEQVAEEACRALLAFQRSAAAVDKHLADQLILPLALADGPSAFLAEEISQHTQTNIWVVEKFTSRRFLISLQEGGLGRVEIRG
jgi:RNA 3'-terminal phosphate cyclase (ATP)